MPRRLVRCNIEAPGRPSCASRAMQCACAAAVEAYERIVDRLEGGVDATLPALDADAVLDGGVDEAFGRREAILQQLICSADSSR